MFPILKQNRVRVFDLVPVPLSELHGWLAARGLVACEHSVKWGERIVVEVRDEEALRGSGHDLRDRRE